MDKRKKIILMISSLVVMLGAALIVYGKYTKRDHRDVVTSAKTFYFTSQQLKHINDSESLPQYTLADWQEGETLTIDLSNSADAKRYSEVSYAYTVHFDYPGKPASVIDQTGTFSGGSQDDAQIQQELTNLAFDQNGEAKVTVTAKTEEPYKSELKGEYVIKKPQIKPAFTYFITDSPGAAYAELHIKSNALQKLALNWDPAVITPNRTDAFLAGSGLTGTNPQEISFSKDIQNGGSAVIKIFKKDSVKDYSITESQVANGGNPVVAVKKNS